MLFPNNMRLWWQLKINTGRRIVNTFPLHGDISAEALFSHAAILRISPGENAQLCASVRLERSERPRSGGAAALSAVRGDASQQPLTLSTEQE